MNEQQAEQNHTEVKTVVPEIFGRFFGTFILNKKIAAGLGVDTTSSKWGDKVGKHFEECARGFLGGQRTVLHVGSEGADLYRMASAAARLTPSVVDYVRNRDKSGKPVSDAELYACAFLGRKHKSEPVAKRTIVADMKKIGGVFALPVSLEEKERQFDLWLSEGKIPMLVRMQQVAFLRNFIDKLGCPMVEASCPMVEVTRPMVEATRPSSQPVVQSAVGFSV